MGKVLYLRLDKDGDMILDMDTNPFALGERWGVSGKTIQCRCTPTGKKRGIKIWDKVSLDEGEK